MGLSRSDGRCRRGYGYGRRRRKSRRMRDQMPSRSQNPPTPPTAKLPPIPTLTPRPLLLVPEADLIGRGAARDAGRDGAREQPALVDGVGVEGGGAVCLVVEVELLHEAGVGLAEGAGFAQAGEGGGGG